MSYGIGRIPADVDPVSEALAALDAQEMMESIPANEPLRDAPSGVYHITAKARPAGSPFKGAIIESHDLPSYPRWFPCAQSQVTYAFSQLYQAGEIKLSDEYQTIEFHYKAPKSSSQHQSLTCKICGQSGLRGEYPFSTAPSSAETCDDCF